MAAAPATVPGVDECLALMEQHHMLPNIRAHSILVARVAELITNGLIGSGHDLSLETVVAGAMLHDIGKTSCLDNDDDHAEKGYEICMAHDLGAIADIVAEHVILKNYLPEAGLTEKEIVYYADKRVNHDQVVSLEERLTYILERYGLNNKVRRRAIRKNYSRCQDLEKRMFLFLDFSPTDVRNLVSLQRSVI
jgi:putative nucleotidyltransferase with HDIG domain